MFELITADPAKSVEFGRELEGAPVQEWTELSGGVCAQAYVGHEWHWIVWPGIGTFRFRPDRRVVEALPEPGASLAEVEDLYARYVLPIAMQAVGAEAIHASAVSSSIGVLGFCGERGAGKSTVAYALSRRGYSHRADDVLALEVGEGSVSVLALPFEPRLRPASAEFFGAATGRRHVRALAGSVKIARETLAGLFILDGHQGDRPPEIRRLSGTQAIVSALQHAHCFNPEDVLNRRRHFQNYLEIAAQVPVIAVRYCYGLDRLEELLDCLLLQVGTPRPNAITGC